MPKLKTFWVSRDGGVCRDHLVLWSSQPLCHERGGVLRFSNTAHGATPSKLEVYHWPALGLSQEPAPGECWEVRWEPIAVLRLQSDRTDALLPIARNVTEELKEPCTDG